MKQYLLFLLLVAHSCALLGENKVPSSPVQAALAKEKEVSVEVPSKDIIASKIGAALLAHKKNPTKENNESLLRVIKTGQSCHEDMPLKEHWLKFVAHKAEQSSETAQIALESHRLMHGKFYFDQPFIIRSITAAGGFIVGCLAMLAYLAAPAFSRN